MKVKSLYLFLFIVSISACKGPDYLTSDPAQTKVVNERIALLINSLNKGDFDQLENLYADDFAGISPSISFKDKAELIESLRRNYKNNPTYIEADQLESHTGILIGYALLQWRIYTVDLATGNKQLIFNKPVLQIWERSNQHAWQLSRVLFYQPDGPLEELKIR